MSLKYEPYDVADPQPPSPEPKIRTPKLDATNLSDTMYVFIGLRKSTPPQNRQLDIWISENEQQVDHFVG